MKDHFQMFARYNAWANKRLFGACGELADDVYMADRPAFFGSIHGTFNHILVGDRAWLARLEDVPSGVTSLDQTLYEDFVTLRDARVQEDVRIATYVDGLTDDQLAGDVQYTSVAGDAFVNPVHHILTHVFNHETHHRGQVHDMLSQTDVAPPPLDLMYYLRETG